MARAIEVKRKLALQSDSWGLCHVSQVSEVLVRALYNEDPSICVYVSGIHLWINCWFRKTFSTGEFKAECLEFQICTQTQSTQEPNDSF